MSDSIFGSERPIPYDRRHRTYVVDNFGVDFSCLWLDAEGLPTTPQRGVETRAVRAEGFITLQRGGLSVKRTAELIPLRQLTDADRRYLATKMVETAAALSRRSADLVEQAASMETDGPLTNEAVATLLGVGRLLEQANMLRGLPSLDLSRNA